MAIRNLETDLVIEENGGVSFRRAKEALKTLLPDGGWEIIGLNDDIRVYLDTEEYPPIRTGLRTRTLTIELKESRIAP